MLQEIPLLAPAHSILGAIAFFIFWILLWFPLAIPTARLVDYQPFQPLTAKQKLPLLASLYIVAPVVVWLAAKLEGTSLSDYGLQFRFSELASLGLGFILGALGLAVVFGIQRLLGWLEWNWREESLSSSLEVKPKNPVSVTTSILLPTFFVGLLVSGIEELIFRGFLLNQLQQDDQIWLAAGLSSFIFALLHLVWEQKETLPQLPGLWLMGMVLVLARLVDGGGLGLACGLHAGWIWSIASLDTANLISYTSKVPAWVTGIGGKPLAGVVGIMYLFLTGIMLWLFYRNSTL